MKAMVLGAGMVGSVMAADLCKDFDVTIADMREANLKSAQERAHRAGGSIRVQMADLSDPATVSRLVAPFDIVLGALSSRIGLAALGAVIDAGRNYCDISFMAEDATALSERARQRGVTAVVDMGVAPGMSNLLAGYEASRMETCTDIEIYVGGLPRERSWPFQYKAGFAPSDVLEEYTRPTRLVEHGQVVVRPALTEPEPMDFAGLGTLEAVNTDGLRSLAFTMKSPFMKEKTLRYPGHYELMRVLRSMGLFSKQPIEVNGQKVVPLDVVSALMFPMWTYQPGEEDLTVMRIINRGVRGGAGVRVHWDILDYYDKASQATSMSRTTAMPCTIMARMIADGTFRQPGVIPPELIGPNAAVVERMLAELKQRGITYVRSEMPDTPR
ncbi:MAG TPA: saccharopine dehydrogenase C-terminal domain-containing protein [Phycisphaerales bacterium]|nr:saccharopine dehydrogenase C-terminal domain-containing protein [Phycisphaerales bacterium]